MSSVHVLLCAVLDLVKLDATRPMLLNVSAPVALLLSHFVDEPITLALGFLFSLLSGLCSALACHTKCVFLADVALSADEMPLHAVIIDHAHRCSASAKHTQVVDT